MPLPRRAPAPLLKEGWPRTESPGRPAPDIISHERPSMSDKMQLRSQAWFGRQDKMGFYYRSFLKNRGFPQDQFEGRPVIGICNTWSELNPCNSHFRPIAEHVRYGVLDAGGFPLEFPVTSLGEVTMRPTAMLFRNLAAMDVEENIRAHPLDGVVLLMGCDKTTPALLMGAARVCWDSRFSSVLGCASRLGWTALC